MASAKRNAQLLGERRGVPSEAVAAHADRVVGLAQPASRVGGPQRQPVGRRRSVGHRMRTDVTPCGGIGWPDQAAPGVRGFEVRGRDCRAARCLS